jgi:alanine racemase
MYGIDITGGHSQLRPVLEFTTQIVQVKTVKKGESIGYDSTFTASNDMKIGVLPVGYNDGLNRKLSNKGSVLIKGILCPIVGRVSMNITTVDITKMESVTVGDTVIVYSKDTFSKVTIKDAARVCEIIPYELLVGLHPSTKREIDSYSRGGGLLGRVGLDAVCGISLPV